LLLVSSGLTNPIGRLGGAFVAAGTAAPSGGIIGARGANLGGWQLTTLGADGRKTVDRTDYFGRTT
jgi:hypothetical protein